jgi:hypothetical protein
MISKAEDIKDKSIIWGVSWQIILILITAISIDSFVSPFSLVASSTCYWILFILIRRREFAKRTLVDRIFIKVGFFVLFFLCWSILSSF